MTRARIRDWRQIVVGFLLLVVLGVWTTSIYQLLAGRVIEARVLSCSLRDCEVAWTVGNNHGTDNTDRGGAIPGQLMQVTYVPGFGVTNRQTEIEVAIFVPAVTVFVFGSSKIKQRRNTSD